MCSILGIWRIGGTAFECRGYLGVTFLYLISMQLSALVTIKLSSYKTSLRQFRAMMDIMFLLLETST